MTAAMIVLWVVSALAAGYVIGRFDIGHTDARPFLCAWAVILGPLMLVGATVIALSLAGQRRREHVAEEVRLCELRERDLLLEIDREIGQ